MNPSQKDLLDFSGNSAHSSGYFGKALGATMYFGGRLEHHGEQIDSATGEPILRYNAGRVNPGRSGSTVLKETKVFLSRGAGILHWGSKPEMIGLEAHDLGLSASILGNGYVHRAYVRCRTGADLQLPCSGCNAASTLAYGMAGNGFEWCVQRKVQPTKPNSFASELRMSPPLPLPTSRYDTGQAHIITNTTFHSCGVRTANGPGSSSSDGCGDGTSSGCDRLSSVWALLGHSDEHVPEFMQATKEIRYVACGLRFRFTNYVTDYGGSLTNGMTSTVSERISSWLDADGTTTGLGAPAIIGSAKSEAGMQRLSQKEASAFGRRLSNQ